MNKPGMINGLCQGDFLGFCLNKFLCLLDETFLLSFFFSYLKDISSFRVGV